MRLLNRGSGFDPKRRSAGLNYRSAASPPDSLLANPFADTELSRPGQPMEWHSSHSPTFHCD
jgi:hypothetical protein